MLSNDDEEEFLPIFGISKSVFAIKENFSFDVFQFLKACYLQKAI